MLYVVTGLPRSGTSMMMRCLEFAGVKPVVNSAREKLMQKKGTKGYRPNPHGFYESIEGDYLKVGFLKSLPDNSAIKLPVQALPVIPVRPVTLIWMHRDIDEVLASADRAFGNDNSGYGEPLVITNEGYKEVCEVRRNMLLESVEREFIQRQMVEDRKSIEVIDVNFADVHANPGKALSFLPPQAALAVDRSLYRNRAA